MRTFTFVTLSLIALTGAAHAQEGPGDLNRAFGMGWESFDTPISPATRDERGNRTIVNGRMEIEGSLTGGLTDLGYSTGLGSVQSIGNQLNVVTQGNYNTVIVESNQINNGDVSASIGGQ